MGISKVTGIAATTLLVTSIILWAMGMRIVVFPFMAISFVAWIVTFASHNAVNLPRILGKNSMGRFPLWSMILFGPFLTLARAYAIVKRFMRKESVYDKIAEGLYLGGWPFMLKHLPPGDPSVIDCTCELPRSSFVPEDQYLCLATWDTRAPAPHQIELATRWACEKRSEGKPVYVHCAFGHGRSACVMCAILVALGVAENWKDAENIIRERRKIKMNALHRKNLEEWSKHRVSQKKDM
uniref:protein-tyrosine-phosphatase n=1 Tax=Arundo donax TaxID=35708 RepID=A0A0A9GBW5_ARUDO